MQAASANLLCDTQGSHLATRASQPLGVPQPVTLLLLT